MNQVKKITNQLDTKLITNMVVGMAVFGGITYAAVRSGIKPLAKVAKGVK